MLVEINGYSFINKELHLFVTDCSEYNLQRIERRDDGFEREFELVFTSKDLDYLYSWLRTQKVVKKARPQTLKEAISLTLGTVATISGKYAQFL